MQAKDFKEFILAFIAAVLDFAGRIMESLKSFASTLSSSISRGVHAVFDPVFSFVKALGKGIHDIASRILTYLRSVGKTIRKISRSVFDNLLQLVNWMKRGFRKISRFVLDKLVRVMNWMKRGFRKIFRNYLLPYYRNLVRTIRTMKVVLIIGIRDIMSRVRKGIGRIRDALLTVASRTFHLLKDLYLMLKPPVLTALSIIYTFFSKLAQIIFRVYCWIIGTSIGFLKRISLAVLRVGYSLSLLLLPIYTYAVWWFHTYHPILAIMGRISLAVVRVGLTTGHIIRRCIGRLYTAVIRVISIFTSLIVSVVVLSGKIITFPFRLMIRGMRHLWNGMCYIASAIGSFLHRLIDAVRIVFSFIVSLVLPMALTIWDHCCRISQRIGQALLTVIVSIFSILQWTASRSLKVLNFIWSGIMKIAEIVTRSIMRTAHFLFHLVTSPIKRSGIAVCRTIMTLIIISFFALGLLGGWFGQILSKIIIPMNFFISRNLLALSRVSYSLSLALRAVVTVMISAFQQVMIYFSRNSRVIAEMTGIFSPSLAGLIWFMFFGSMTALLGAVIYFILISSGSYFYNKYYGRDTDV